MNRKKLLNLLATLALSLTACNAIPGLGAALPTLAPTPAPSATNAAPASTALPQPTGAAALAATPTVASALPTSAAAAITPTAPQPTPTEGECLARHTVQAGERLLRIGERYNVDWRVVAQYNKIANPERLLVGQVLCIPSRATLAQLTARPLTATAAAPTSTATAVPLKINTVSLSSPKGDRGSQITVQWETAGANQVNIWAMKYDPKLDKWSRDTAAPAFALGKAANDSLAIEIPKELRNPMRVEIEAVSSSGQRLVKASDEISSTCHKLFFDPTTNVACPLPPQTTKAVLQPFEHGYLIWRQDTNKVYRLWTATQGNAAWDTVQLENTPAGNVGTPPAGLQAPSARLAPAWLQFNDLDRAQFGWATGVEQEFDLTTQLNLYPGYTNVTADSLYLTWPDGRLAHLLVEVSVTDHEHGSGWSFVKR